MTVRGPYEIVHKYIGLSTDTKPDAQLGDEFFETNTFLTYVYNGSSWSLKSAAYWSRSGSVADDGSITLPTLTKSAIGMIVAGDDAEHTLFTSKADGTVTLISNTTNVVANANTDGNLCVGTSVANPIIVKNRLGASKNILIVLTFN